MNNTILFTILAIVVGLFLGLITRAYIKQLSIALPVWFFLSLAWILFHLPEGGLIPSLIDGTVSNQNYAAFLGLCFSGTWIGMIFVRHFITSKDEEIHINPH